VTNDVKRHIATVHGKDEKEIKNVFDKRFGQEIKEV
jgi:hypothetical protein